MPTDLRAELAKMLEEYRAMTDALEATHAAAATLCSTARSADAAATVTVHRVHGLQALAFEPDAVKRLSPRDLAERVLEAVATAQADLQAHLRRTMADALPERVRAAMGSDGDVDLRRLLPDPVRLSAELGRTPRGGR